MNSKLMDLAQIQGEGITLDMNTRIQGSLVHVNFSRVIQTLAATQGGGLWFSVTNII